MPLWEQVKSNLAEWYSVAADKTEELAKIGIRRYDKFGISRDIEHQFTELGSLVNNKVSEGREDFLSDPTLQAIIERIKSLEEDLRLKEAEIEEIRETHGQKDAMGGDHAAGPEGARVDPALVVEASMMSSTVGMGESAPEASTEGTEAGEAQNSPLEAENDKGEAQSIEKD